MNPEPSPTNPQPSDDKDGSFQPHVTDSDDNKQDDFNQESYDQDEFAKVSAQYRAELGPTPPNFFRLLPTERLLPTFSGSSQLNFSGSSQLNGTDLDEQDYSDQASYDDDDIPKVSAQDRAELCPHFSDT